MSDFMTKPGAKGILDMRTCASGPFAVLNVFTFPGRLKVEPVGDGSGDYFLTDWRGNVPAFSEHDAEHRGIRIAPDYVTPRRVGRCDVIHWPVSVICMEESDAPRGLHYPDPLVYAVDVASPDESAVRDAVAYARAQEVLDFSDEMIVTTAAKPATISQSKRFESHWPFDRFAYELLRDAIRPKVVFAGDREAIADFRT